jgi:hypothetical protein
MVNKIEYILMIIVLIIFLGLGIEYLFADSPSTLTELMSATTDDQLIITDTPGTTPTTKRITTNNLFHYLTVAAPVFKSMANQILMYQASASVDGYLDNDDWTTFNNKQDALTAVNTSTIQTVVDSGQIYSSISTTSAALASAVSDETGAASGSPLAVFNQNPTLNSAVITGKLDLNLVDDNVQMFYGYLCPDGSNGKSFELWRHAAEGDTIMSFQINDTGACLLTGYGDLTSPFFFAFTGNLSFTSSAGEVNFSSPTGSNFFSWTSGNPYIRQWGYLTSGGNQFVEWAVKATGKYTLDRNDVSIGAVDFNLPVEGNSFTTGTGATIDEFSTDGTLAGNSDTAAPTEKAVKTYVDANHAYNVQNLRCIRQAADVYNVDIDFEKLNCSGYALGTGDITIDCNAGTGANKLDTGSLAASTWYAIHVIYKPSDGTIGGLISLSRTSPTLPAGYTASRCIGWARTTADTEIKTFHYNGGGWWFYDTTSNIVNAGTDTTWTAVDASTYLPPTSTLFYGGTRCTDNASAAAIFARATGDSGTIVSGYISIGGATSTLMNAITIISTDSSQSFDYYISSDDTSGIIWISAYLDNITPL